MGLKGTFWTGGWWLHECACSISKSRPTLCDPLDWSPPSSFVHRISQARILEWVAVPGLPCPPPGDYLRSGVELPSPTDSLPLGHWGSSGYIGVHNIKGHSAIDFGSVHFALDTCSIITDKKSRVESQQIDVGQVAG